MGGRHELLSVAPADWHLAVNCSQSVAVLLPEVRHLVESWALRGWPVICRRRLPDDPAGSLAVGLPLPPSLGKQRLSFAVHRQSAVRPFAPVSLAQSSACVPKAWSRQVSGVGSLASRIGLQPYVFGALLWQHLTGLPYLRPESDIDLLWPGPDRRGSGLLLDGLDMLDQIGPARLDGEILLPSGAGVNWRELRQALATPNGTVLVKFLNGAKIECAADLFRATQAWPEDGYFPAPPCRCPSMRHRGSAMSPSSH
jgi:phosphoribosyl-dephospho-CoA transferase